MATCYPTYITLRVGNTRAATLSCGDGPCYTDDDSTAYAVNCILVHGRLTTYVEVVTSDDPLCKYDVEAPNMALLIETIITPVLMQCMTRVERRAHTEWTCVK